MPGLERLIANYQEIIVITNKELSSVKTKIRYISTIRILLFVLGIIGVIYFYSSGLMAVLCVVLLTFVPFLVFVKYHDKLFNKRDYLEKKIEINQQELNAFDYDFSAFDNGTEYINSSHLYSYDLDIFGNNSLFQSVNRTSTFFGKEYLADWFNTHLDKKEEIEGRQEAIRELTDDIELRQHFRIIGLLYKGKISDGAEIDLWAKSENTFRNCRIYQSAIILVPLINAIFLLGGLFGLFSFNLLGLSFMFFVICNFFLQKTITQFQTMYEKKLNILSTYAGLMEVIEKRNMRSDLLKRIQRLLRGEKYTASMAVKQLSKEMNALNQRNNILVSVILNGFLFWELRQVIRIEAWKGKYANELSDWLAALGRIDALCSLATFAYNHPDYTYPKIASQSFELKAVDMGHPLMNRNKCVKNSVMMPEEPYFVIVTGANMAGKSTYLRTIGVNYLLACVGAPVNCTEMSVYPSRLITSLRTSDSLADNESYFYAELKRMKLIIDKLNAGEKLFIILDEILRGTNSKDKQKGSLALIKQLIALRAVGIIATHDLLLGTLAEVFPECVRNYSFEADIIDDELSFSYNLREGVAENMNACFLMNKMGIVVAEDN